MSRFWPLASAKIGRTNKVQPGQIAGADEPRLAHKMPATNVPCVQAKLSARWQAPPSRPGISRIVVLERSAWSVMTGPSIRPIVISGLPLLSFISGR